MSNISSFPTAIPDGDDLMLGSQANAAGIPSTKNFTVQSIVDLAVVGTYLPIAGGTIAGNLSVDGALTLKTQTSGPNQGFAVLTTEGGTGAILVNGTLNITDSIAMQGTNANIMLTNPGGYVALTSPNQTTYKITVDDQGNLVTTQIS
jgi:hypothetical protein